MDVVTTFLHSRLEKEVHKNAPPYMGVQNLEGKVLSIKGALYGCRVI